MSLSYGLSTGKSFLLKGFQQDQPIPLLCLCVCECVPVLVLGRLCFGLWEV